MSLPSTDVLLAALHHPTSLAELSEVQWDLLIRQGRRADVLARIGENALVAWGMGRCAGSASKTPGIGHEARCTPARGAGSRGPGNCPGAGAGGRASRFAQGCRLCAGWSGSGRRANGLGRGHPRSPPAPDRGRVGPDDGWLGPNQPRRLRPAVLPPMDARAASAATRQTGFGARCPSRHPAAHRPSQARFGAAARGHRGGRR